MGVVGQGGQGGGGEGSGDRRTNAIMNIIHPLSILHYVNLMKCSRAQVIAISFETDRLLQTV